MIPYGKQLIDNEDIKSIKKTLLSNWLTTGPKVEEFEKKIERITNSKYSIAVNSATSALHLACLSLNLKKGDYVWTSPNTFVSTSNAALLCGAKVDFVDIELDNYNICVKNLEFKLKNTPKKKLPKILIPVHFGGHSCDMKSIRKLSKKYKFKIIEDASHALGATYLDSITGDCKYSDICVFSLHPVKIITTGEGGIVTTNNKEIYQKVKALRSHGIYRNLPEKKNELKNKPWMFFQKELGLNYRLTDIQSSLGISQLKKLKKFLKKRKFIAKIYDNSFKDLPLTLPRIKKNIFSTYHLYPVLIKKNKKNINRDKFYKILLKKGIKTNIHYIPVYHHPFYKKLEYNKKFFKNNEYYFKNTISLPIFPGLKLKELQYIIKIIRKILI